MKMNASLWAPGTSSYGAASGRPGASPIDNTAERAGAREARATTINRWVGEEEAEVPITIKEETETTTTDHGTPRTMIITRDSLMAHPLDAAGAEEMEVTTPRCLHLGDDRPARANGQDTVKS